MSELNGTCPMCGNHCPLNDPGCGRGRRYVEQLGSGIGETLKQMRESSVRQGEHQENPEHHRHHEDHEWHGHHGGGEQHEDYEHHGHHEGHKRHGHHGTHEHYDAAGQTVSQGE